MSAVTPNNSDKQPTFFTDFPGLGLTKPPVAFQLLFYFFVLQFLVILFDLHAFACLSATYQNRFVCMFAQITLRED
jgi:hypothetical protein